MTIEIVFRVGLKSSVDFLVIYLTVFFNYKKLVNRKKIKRIYWTVYPPSAMIH